MALGIPDIRRIQLLDSATQNAIQGDGGILDQLDYLNGAVGQMLVSQANFNSSPVANLLYNGELGHSNFTWFEVSGTPSGDKNAECAFWFSHNTPAAAHSFIDTDIDTTADTITLTNHEFTNGCTVDLLTTGGSLPSPLVVSTTYFVIYVNADTIKLATTIGNAESATAINITTQGSSAQTFTIQQELLSITDYTSAVNNELKTIAHSTYDPRYSRWDSANGQGDLTGTTTIDALMPTNNVDATTPLARVSLIAARANQYIELTNDCLMAAGIWDNTSGQRKFLSGSISFNASLIGATGPVERRFRACLTSDRGYQLLSDEVVLPATPTTLTDLNYIGMSWAQQAGQLQVDIYEHYDPSGANEYRLVTQVSSATSFIYEGDFISVVAGYPDATGTLRSGTFFTQKGDMSDLSINGSTWDTVNFPINIPNSYNKGLTTNRQWVRVWLTVAPNLFINSVITDGTATITIPSGAVNSAAFASGGYGSGGSSLYDGLVAEVYDNDDALLATTTVSSVTSNTVIVLGSSVASGTDRKLRIVGGGFHGVIIDKIHLGYQQNTSYAPNANDNRTLQPISAPDGSSQGTVGGGGDGGGVQPCVAGDTPIELFNGEWERIDSQKEGALWASGQIRPNALIKLKKSKTTVPVRRVRTANGCEIICTDGEAFVTSPMNVNKGMFLFRLREGDSVLTRIDGRIESSKITLISKVLYQERVYTPSLSNDHIFIGGKLALTFWQRVKKTLGMAVPSKGGFVLHNRKPDPDPFAID